MIQSNEDLYQHLNNLIKILKDNNESACAEQLEGALNLSTVPSEVLGETRVVLQKLLVVKFAKRSDMKSKILEILNYLNTILSLR